MGRPALNRRRKAGSARAARGAPALLAVLAALVLTACTPPGLPPPQSPSGLSSASAEPARSGGVTIGVDGALTGFNPYLLSDYSPAAAAVAGVVLPSVSQVGNDGVRRVAADLVDSATVIDQDPFTVRYRINRNAAWSDGTPVTAEDFRYLAQQLGDTDATLDNAAYRTISAVRSGDGGKTAEVVFTQPVHDWLQLFSPLLPAHLLKDSPGGFAGALAGGIPVSAGPFRLAGVDESTGEITLERNDKYWGPQSSLATVVFRSGTGAALVNALGRNDVQAVYLRPGAVARRALDRLVTAGTVRAANTLLPAQTQIVFDTANGPTADAGLRTALAESLNGDALAALASRQNPAALLAAPDPLRLPTTAGERPAPATDAAQRQLIAAGYRLSGLYLTGAAGPLRLSLGYPIDDLRLASVADAVQRQLGAAGVEVDLLADTPADLTRRLQAGELSMLLQTVPRGQSDSIAAASAFGCSQVPVDGPATGDAPAPATTAAPALTPPPAGLTGTEAPAPATTTDVPPSSGTETTSAATETRVLGGLGRFCPQALQQPLAQALRDGLTGPLDAVIAPAVRSRQPVYTIGRPAATLAVRTELASGAVLPAGAGDSLLSTLPRWPSP